MLRRKDDVTLIQGDDSQPDIASKEKSPGSDKSFSDMISEEHRDLTDSISVEGGKTLKKEVDKKSKEIPETTMKPEQPLPAAPLTVEIPETSNLDDQKVCVRR